MSKKQRQNEKADTASHVHRFVLRLLGYRPVTVPGYHCGCCESWNNEPREVLRKHGQYEEKDKRRTTDECR